MTTFTALESGSREYNRIHGIVRDTYGLAAEYYCIECEKPAHEWAWQHDKNPQLITSYEPLCYSCHKKYDMTEEKKVKMRAQLICARSERGNQSEYNTGSKNGKAILGDKDVLEIRIKYASGNYTYKDLGYIYGVSYLTISSIVRRQRWKHL